MAIKRMPSARFVAELEAALKRGDGYIMASYGQNPRTGYLDLSVPESKCKSAWKENGWYYSQYSGSQRTQALKWRKKCTRVWDCNGMAEGIYEIFSGVCINARARNNYASWCNTKGTGVIPAKYRVPGAAVFWGSKASEIHHVAYLWKPVITGKPEGDWYLIEARGVMYGVVKSKLLSRKPNYWGLMDKYFDYTGVADDITVTPIKLGDRIPLKNGMEGDDVKEMQSALISLGYNLGSYGSDGDFGDCTEMAVRKFQEDQHLTVSGKYDAATHTALSCALAGLTWIPDSATMKYVEIMAGKQCYVRLAPNTDGEALGVAHSGDRLPYKGQTAENGWHRVEYKGVDAWVSGKYSRLTD